MFADPLQEESLPPAVTPDLTELWSRIQAELRRTVPESTYDIWLAPLRPSRVDGVALEVECPRELRGRVADRYGQVLKSCATAILGPAATVEVRATTAPGAGGAPAPAETHGRAAPETDPGLNPKLTFDQFVIGDGNRLAHAAALAVAENPGGAYNPLFIYGPPGVGKTHLLQSIGNYVRAYGSGLAVRYTTVERFTNQFLDALRSGKVDRFKGRFRRNDVLLIDDVQFLEAKAKTEEEFFHTFNALHEAGGQLVLTSDRTPRDLAALEDRLRDRFESGLVTDISAPDHATRVTVLRKRVQHDAIPLTDGAVLDLIAQRVPMNVRALEGALIRVVAYASLTGRPLDAHVAGEVLDGLYPAAGRPPLHAERLTVERIQDVVAEAFGLTREELVSAGRQARVAWPRQLAMYLAREHTRETLPTIGRRFGGRNHTTVLHACKRTAERLAADRDAYETVRRLTDRLTRDGADRRD
jgi:chromosomal replication initiator protein